MTGVVGPSERSRQHLVIEMHAFGDRARDEIATDGSQVPRVTAREEGAAGGRAVLVRVMALQAHALARELVQRRREDLGIVIARVVPPEVIRENEYQVRRLTLGIGKRGVEW